MPTSAVGSLPDFEPGGRIDDGHDLLLVHRPDTDAALMIRGIWVWDKISLLKSQ